MIHRKRAQSHFTLALSANLTALQIVPQSRFCIFAPSHFDRLSD